MQNESTLNTAMLPHSERLADSCATTTAILRSEVGGNDHNITTGTRSLALMHFNESCPRRVTNALGEMVILDHPCNVQILKRDRIKLADKLKAQFVEEIKPLALNLQMSFRQKSDGLAPTRAVPLLSGNRALRGFESPLRLAQASRVVNCFARRERSKVFNTNVYPNCIVGLREVARLVFFDGKHDEPAVNFSFDRDGFDLAFNGTRKPQSTTADFGKRQFVPIKFESLFAVGKRIITRLRSKTRVARFTFLYSPKEAVKRALHASERVFQNHRIESRNVSPVAADVGQLINLVVEGNVGVIDAPCITALLKRSVVKLTAQTKNALKFLDNMLRRSELVAVRFHALIIPQKCELKWRNVSDEA